MGGKGGGGKKGGGGSGSVDVDVESDSASSMVLDIVGLDDIKLTTNSTTDSNSTNRLELPDPIDTRLTLNVPETVRTDQQQRSELAITEPIVTQMSTDLDVDVKPVVVDLCLTLGIKDPPRFCVSRPYDKHISLSLFGREVLDLNWCGTEDFVIDDVRSGFVSGVVETPTGRHRHHGLDHHDGFDHADHGEGPGRRAKGVRFVVD